MNKFIKSLTCAATVLVGLTSFNCDGAKIPNEITLSKGQLLDKIKGGWAGQNIGVTYGGPTEFRYRGTMMQDYIPIEWDEHYIKRTFDTMSFLYDDVYMDLTFVEVFDRLGLDAPVDSFALAFANAPYQLWHANQAARYNILHGIMPPASGHWLNNPHADDIDYQIEADYAGLMSPGMPNTASEISDKIGHIMNYGNGWYGGVYVGAMYSLSFVSNDIQFIVKEALKTIPKESSFYQCMTDVIKWHKKYPKDWRQTWAECEKKWSAEVGCPEGVFEPLNIDAMINSAYVIIGLLYGDGDFEKTMEISTRCGQDSDCNPATAAGILGTILGYDAIPQKYIVSHQEIEDLIFPYTKSTMKQVFQMSFNHSLEMIKRNGGSVSNDNVTIKCQKPQAVQLEECFKGIYPTKRRDINRSIRDLKTTQFNGCGIVFRGWTTSPDNKYVAEVEMHIDGKLVETAKLPAHYLRARFDLFWNYQLTEGNHTVEFKWLNPKDGVNIHFSNIQIYSKNNSSANKK